MKDTILLAFGFISGVLITAAFGEKVKSAVAGLLIIARAWIDSIKIGNKG